MRQITVFYSPKGGGLGETVAFGQTLKPKPSPLSHFWKHVSWRFLNSVQTIQVVLMSFPGQSLSVFNFRRIQMTEQQTEKQRKNLLQKCLIFKQRARELQAQDIWLYLATFFGFYSLQEFLSWILQWTTCKKLFASISRIRTSTKTSEKLGWIRSRNLMTSGLQTFRPDCKLTTQPQLQCTGSRQGPRALYFVVLKSFLGPLEMVNSKMTPAI